MTTTTGGTTLRIAAARLMAANREVYLSDALWSLVMVPIKDLGKFVPGNIAVDKWWRCYYDPDLIERYSIEALSWLLVHEAWHLLRNHADRSRALGVDRQPFLFIVNAAGDLEIDDDLVKAGAKFPYKGVIDAKLGLPPDLLMEDYYHRLLDMIDEANKNAIKHGAGTCPACGKPLGTANAGSGLRHPSGEARGTQPNEAACNPGARPAGPAANEPPGNPGSRPAGPAANEPPGNPEAGTAGPRPAAAGGKDQADIGIRCPHCGAQLILIPGLGPPTAGAGACGSSAHGVQQPWERGDPSGSKHSDGIGHTEAELIREGVAKKIQEHARTCGSMPAGFLRWADAILQPPRINWLQQLASYFRAALSHAAGMMDYTYSRPSRRQAAMPKFVVPAMRRPVPQVVIVVDTSGSMSDPMLMRILSEIVGVLRAIGQRDAVTVLSCDADVHCVQRVFNAKQIRLHGGGGTDMRVGIDRALERRPKPDVVLVMSDGLTPWGETEPTGAQVIVGLVDQNAREEVPPWAKIVDIDVDSLEEAEAP